MERFDWKAHAALRKKSRKSWDAVRQLMHYSEVVGGGEAISVQAPQAGDRFRDVSQFPALPAKSK